VNDLWCLLCVFPVMVDDVCVRLNGYPFLVLENNFAWMYARDGFSALNFLIVCRKKNDNQVKSLINAFDCEKLISSCGGLWELVRGIPGRKCFTSGADGFWNNILFGITNLGHLICRCPMLLALKCIVCCVNFYLSVHFSACLCPTLLLHLTNNIMTL